MKKMGSIILAAGDGKRMKSSLPKMLHRAAGKPLVEWVVEAAEQALGVKPIVVYGAGGSAVPDYLGERCVYALQAERKGSGHAVMMARELMAEYDYVTVIAGDMPLVEPSSIHRLAELAEQGEYAALLLTGKVVNPAGYGRILRDGAGRVTGIVEDKDATPEQKEIDEINLSFYCFQTRALAEALDEITPANAQGEYYLTDCIAMLAATGRVGGLLVDAQQCSGVNDKAQLAAAEAIMRRRINHEYLVGGVIMMDPDHTYIEDGAVIGQDTILYPGCHIRGKSAIGADCVIESGTVIDGSTVGDRCHIRDSVIMDSTVGNDVTIGPFAYLRPATVVEDGVHIGDFVEIKKARIGEGTKLPHLTYVGDADVGAHCNIACGTIFANYDGLKKYQTTVGDGVFIGCNVNLVAPVAVREGAYVAAGTTVTEEVEAGSMAIGRVRAETKPEWADKRRKQGKLK